MGEGGKKESKRESEDEEEAESSSDSEVDAPNYESRRECNIRELIIIEKQFLQLKERLYRERIQQIERRGKELSEGFALDLRRKVELLEADCEEQCKIMGLLSEFQNENAESMLTSSQHAAEQNFENDCRLLYDRIASDVDGKIEKLKAEKHAADVNLSLWMLENSSPESSKGMGSGTVAGFGGGGPGARRRNRQFRNKRLRKVTTVSGPFIVYMLSEEDIEKDWAIVRRATVESEILDSNCLQSPVAMEIS